MSGRGGPRHHTKPLPDAGLLLKVLLANEGLLTDLGPYELRSRAQTPDPKGLVHTLSLWQGLLAVEPSGEVHSKPLRQALLAALTQNPLLNLGKFTGEVWVNLRQERLTCLLCHVRKQARETLGPAAARLTRDELLLLKAGLSLVKPAKPTPEALEKGQAGSGNLEKRSPASGTLEKGSPAASALEKSNTAASAVLKKNAALGKVGGSSSSSRPLKKLKKEQSEVSVDADGFPLMFGEGFLEKEPVGSAGKFGKQVKQRQCPEVAMDESGFPSMFASSPEVQKADSEAEPEAKALAEAKGYSKPTLKRPAGARAAVAKAEAKPLEKGRVPWFKIKKTLAKKPERAYLTGSLEKGGKLKLIAEVTQKRCPQYEEIIDAIKEALEKDSLSKAEALELRESFCVNYDC